MSEVLDGRGTSLRLRRRLPAPPERAFAAWTDPVLLARWMTPVGIATAEADVRVGGRFRVVMTGDGRSIEHTGEYLDVHPPHRLRFTWTSPYTGPAASVVTVTLVPSPDGGTDMELLHEELPFGAAPSHAGGWGRMVDRLVAILGSAA